MKMKIQKEVKDTLFWPFQANNLKTTLWKFFFFMYLSTPQNKHYVGMVWNRKMTHLVELQKCPWTLDPRTSIRVQFLNQMESCSFWDTFSELSNTRVIPLALKMIASLFQNILIYMYLS